MSAAATTLVWIVLTVERVTARIIPFKPPPAFDWRVLAAPVIWAGALGYLVDIYDANVGANYREQIFRDFGVPASQTVPTLVALANWSRAGLLLGGLLWGILGDRIGRVVSLFGSIALYSVGALVVAFFCHSLEGFKVAGFFMGIGLAGELGGSVTLVLESLSTSMRTFGIMMVAAMGMLGVVLSGLLAEAFPWRSGYAIGGVMGLALLALRLQVHESLLFERMERTGVSRGNWLRLLWPWPMLQRYLCCILIGVPAIYVLFFYNSFAPELGRQLHLAGELKINRVNIVAFSGMAVGDLLVAWLSYRFKSRKRPLLWFMGLSAVAQALIMLCHGAPVVVVYGLFFVLGVAAANALFVTTTAEQFGTNLRDTAATTVTNIVRFAVVPAGFLLAAWEHSLGLGNAGLLINLATLALGILALSRLEESYGVSIAFLEGEEEENSELTRVA